MKNSVLIAILGILFIAAGFGGAGCSVGSGSSGDAGSVYDISDDLGDEGNWPFGGDEVEIDDDDVIVEREDGDDETDSDDVGGSDDTGGVETCEGPEFSALLLDQTVIQGSPIIPITISISGGSGNFEWDFDLPDGLVFNPDLMTIEGIPTAPMDTYESYVRVDDLDCGAFARLTFNIKILGVPKAEIAPPTIEIDTDAVDCSARPDVRLRLTGEATEGTHILYLSRGYDEVVDVYRKHRMEGTVFTDTADGRLRFTFSSSIRTPDEYGRYYYPIRSVDKEVPFEIYTGDTSGEKTITISAYDTKCKKSHKYDIVLNSSCKVGKIKDLKVKFTGEYYNNYSSGFCKYTKAHWALINEEYPGGVKNNRKHRLKNVLASEGRFYLTRGARGHDEDYIAEYPYVWDVLEEHFNKNVDAGEMCADEITGWIFWIADEGCGGTDPSIRITGAKLEACRLDKDTDEVTDQCFSRSWPTSSTIVNNDEVTFQLDNFQEKYMRHYFDEGWVELEESPWE